MNHECNDPDKWGMVSGGPTRSFVYISYTLLIQSFSYGFLKPSKPCSKENQKEVFDETEVAALNERKKLEPNTMIKVE